MTDFYIQNIFAFLLCPLSDFRGGVFQSILKISRWEYYNKPQLT